MKTSRICLNLVLIGCLLPVVAVPVSGKGMSKIEKLGKAIFSDRNLSLHRNQSCKSCHAPKAGWSGPDSDINAKGAVFEGSVEGLFGNRKPPSAAYATQSPIFHGAEEAGETLFIGGNFWDGRATGERLGNPAADQALGPFLNPVEQALPDAACVVKRVCTAKYAKRFKKVWGKQVCNIDFPENIDEICADPQGIVELDEENRRKVDAAYDRVGLSIAAFEASSKVNAFSSKFDYYLAGRAELSPLEKQGLELFMGKGKCANCHVLDGPRPLFTDFTYDNLGVPRNPENPWYRMTDFNPDGFDWIDVGLGGFLASRDDYSWFARENFGKQKVPTLRNVDKRPYPGFVKAYTHNGYFKSLKSLVHFYNTRDIKPRCDDPFTKESDALAMGCWPAPEVPENVNTTELGDLGLTEQEEDAIVSFLKTLSDGYKTRRRKHH